MTEDYIFSEDMSVGYGGKALIEEIRLHVKRGEIVTLIGPNGAGKSTILKTVAGELELIRGTVYLDGTSMETMTEKEIAKKRSILMTGGIRPEFMTCREVVEMGRYPYTGRLGILSEKDREAVKEAICLVHGETLEEQEFSELSDGQKQRILLARAICQEPSAIILDEPTSFLDIRHKLELLSILKELVRKRRTAILMSLHELELAQRISDQVVCVKGNRIYGMGRPEEIFRSFYIKELFDMTRGSYDAETGFLEMEAVKGKPEVFVIGGNGTGMAVYRFLQRKGIPFAAGILHENDREYSVARALAVEVVKEQAFEPIGEAAFRQAKELMKTCSSVICCLETFGTMNEKNRQLAFWGKKREEQQQTEIRHYIAAEDVSRLEEVFSQWELPVI